MIVDFEVKEYIHSLLTSLNEQQRNTLLNELFYGYCVICGYRHNDIHTRQCPECHEHQMNLDYYCWNKDNV